MHDGPGLRTTVFLKGCPLKCIWCHNPESIGNMPIELDAEKRIGKKVFIEKEIIGEYMHIEDVVKEIQKDTVFYEESGGGVTLSGGEPLMQFNFALELLKQLKELGIHTAIDTSGFVPSEKLEQILPHTDLFLYDLKHLDKAKHLQYTGVSNETILQNLELLVKKKSNVSIRVPLIPGYNTDTGYLSELVAYLHTLGENIREIHLLPYHNWAKNKYQKLHLEYKLDEVESTPEEELIEVKAYFESQKFNVKIHG